MDPVAAVLFVVLLVALVLVLVATVGVPVRARQACHPQAHPTTVVRARLVYLVASIHP
jgi:hypothetical protein